MRIALALCSVLAWASEPSALTDRPEVQAFIQSMVSRHGFDPQALIGELSGLQPRSDVIEKVLPPRTQGSPKSWRAYRTRFIEPIRIRAGVAFWNAHHATLARAEKETGVPAEIIVGILGTETLYGRWTGRYPVLESLVTLAFDYPDTPNRERRTLLFTRQLEEYLLLCRESGRSPRSLTGSYTGAIGIPQFLPGSIRAHAVDYDRDGRIDLLESPADAIGSVARFLVDHGWKRGRPILWPLRPTPETRESIEILADGSPELRWRVGGLMDLGIQPSDLAARQRKLFRRTEEDTPALLVDLPTPGHPTEYRIGLRNFYVITRYNQSFFYATTVVELGRAVKQARQKAARRKKK